jgi:hypothetical protein
VIESGGSRLLRELPQLIALVAALAGVVYVTGALVLAIRLFLERLPVQAVVGELPREFLVSIGMAQVILPALIIVSLYIGYRFVRGDRARVPRPPGEAPRTRLAAFVATAFLLVLPGVVLSIVHRHGARLIVGVLLLGPTALVMTAFAIFVAATVRSRVLQRSEAAEGWRWNEWRAVLAVALAYGFVLVVPLISFAAAFRPSDAKVCTTSGQWINGMLLGETGRGVYLGERKSGPRRIVFVPLAQTGALFVGSNAAQAVARSRQVARSCSESAGPP